MIEQSSLEIILSFLIYDVILFMHYPLSFHVIIPSSLLHSEYSGLEMEVTGIVSILEAMEGIDISLFCLCGHINSVYLKRRGRNVGSSLF